jgi:hypothetical protein
VPTTWVSSIARRSATDAVWIGAKLPVPAAHTTTVRRRQLGERAP